MEDNLVPVLDECRYSCVVRVSSRLGCDKRKLLKLDLYVWAIVVDP